MSGHRLDDAFRDALVLGLENDSHAEDVLRIARPFIDRAFEELQSSVAGLERVRPVWAQGFSSDSVAAQVNANALAELWELLGVDSQTDAVKRLKELRGDCLEERPTVAEIRAERERSGDGLVVSRRRIVRDRLERQIWRANDVADLRAIARAMLDYLDPSR